MLSVVRQEGRLIGIALDCRPPRPYIPPMSPKGSIIIHAECACGHRAVLTAELLGEAPDYFMGFDRLRCSRCGRRGRPASVIRYWSSSAERGVAREPSAEV